MHNIQDFKDRIRGNKVLVRVDFNVPVNDEGYVIDDNRIRQALPTIKYILEKGAPVLMSHLGRPKGKVVENLRMEHVGEALQEIVGNKYRVITMDSWDFQKIRAEIDASDSNSVILLENLRFKKEEEKEMEPDSKKRREFAKKLASLAPVYVNDAFGTCHNEDTSVYYVPQYAPSAAGFLIQKELKSIQAILQDPGERFNVILGGAKVTDKIGVIENLYEAVSRFFIGGKMCLAFLKARGYGIGAAEIDEKDYEEARRLLDKYGEAKITLPTDMLVAEDNKKDARHKRVSVDKIPFAWFPLDIGEDTLLHWKPLIARGSSFFWNGPLGRAEFDFASKGTHELAETIFVSHLRGIIGGGDTLAAVKGTEFDPKKVFLSTGGGTTLEYLGGRYLPALKALDKSAEKFR